MNLSSTGMDPSIGQERRAPVTPTSSSRYNRRRSSGSRDERYRSGKTKLSKKPTNSILCQHPAAAARQFPLFRLSKNTQHDTWPAFISWHLKNNINICSDWGLWDITWLGLNVMDWDSLSSDLVQITPLKKSSKALESVAEISDVNCKQNTYRYVKTETTQWFNERQQGREISNCSSSTSIKSNFLTVDSFLIFNYVDRSSDCMTIQEHLAKFGFMFRVIHFKASF